MSIMGYLIPSRHQPVMPKTTKPNDPPIRYEGAVLNGHKTLEERLAEDERNRWPLKWR